MTKIELKDLSPKAQKLLEVLSKTSGTADTTKTIEDMTFTVYELLQLIDTSRDPNIYPQDAINVMTTVNAVLTKFKRFGDPTKAMEANAEKTNKAEQAEKTE